MLFYNSKSICALVQHSLQSKHLFLQHEIDTKFDSNACVALTQILPTFGSIFLNLNEKIVGVDCMMR
jgi:hypothetical protein